MPRAKDGLGIGRAIGLYESIKCIRYGPSAQRRPEAPYVSLCESTVV